jgi:hypothetical protein
LPALALLVAGPGRATAAWPPPAGADLSSPSNWPNDPDYAGQWNYWSFLPAVTMSSVAPNERALGSGAAVDQAWQLTTGRREVLITVLDSGIRWVSPDLVNKWFLNRGELPVPAAACGHGPAADPWDANGDGVFNVQDYTTARGHEQPKTPCDPRVRDTNGNGIIDPQDLIAVFSNGRDDDHDGYVDNISGWDFLEDDNDPNDDTSFGHGTAESHWSAAEGGNGLASLGTCPDCSIMIVRVGDAFVVDSDEFAMGVLFAVDSGASVIQEALGAYSNSAFARAAIDYAYKKDVVIVGAAGDEDSYHLNFPSSNQHMVQVNSIRPDNDDWHKATTFLNFNNCTNYGSQVVVSVPSYACSSEATGRTAGMAGLLQSLALARGIPPHSAPRTTTTAAPAQPRLSAEEVKQLLIAGSDDLVLTNVDVTTRYPAQVGWDQRFGYGRANAGRAAVQLAAGRIPPEADIDRPTWFEVLDPGLTPKVPIVAHAAIRSDRYQSFDWTLEYAPGIQPPDRGSAWHPIATGVSVAAPLVANAALAEWDISQLNIDNPPLPEPDRAADRYMVTLRLRVVAHSTTLGDVSGVMRKTVFIKRDPTLVTGFPIDLGTSGESSPKLVDLDGDGKAELVIGDASGRVHAYTARGTELGGWPVTVGPLRTARNHMTAAAFASGAIDPDLHSPVLGAPAVGSLAGDGSMDVVVATRSGEVWAFASDGKPLAGFPIEAFAMHPAQNPATIVDVGFFAAPTLVDLDGDGRLEIVIGAFDGQVHAWHADGSAVAGFPVPLHDAATPVMLGDVGLQRIVATAATGDLDRDGKRDIVVASSERYGMTGRVYAIYHDGTMHPGGPFLPGWPVRDVLTADLLPVVGQGVPNAPVVADVDGDGADDVVVMGVGGLPVVYHGDGSHAAVMLDPDFGAGAEATDGPLNLTIANAAVADLDGDGVLDIIAPGSGLSAVLALLTRGRRYDSQYELGAWNARTGAELPAFPRRNDEWQLFVGPIIADVDGDGRADAVLASAGPFVHAWNADGVEARGFPKTVGSWVVQSAAVGDMDGDGKLELAVGTRSGLLFAWHTQGATSTATWSSFHHDLANTGNVATRTVSGTPATAQRSSGGCTVAGRAPAPGAAVAWIACGLALALRRRRRQ